MRWVVSIKLRPLYTQFPLDRGLLKPHSFHRCAGTLPTLSPLRWHFLAAKVCWHGIVWAKEDVCLLCYTSQELSAFNTCFRDLIQRKTSPDVKRNWMYSIVICWSGTIIFTFRLFIKRQNSPTNSRNKTNKKRCFIYKKLWQFDEY